MKTITFLTYHKGIQGSFMNHLDLQQHLKDHEGYKIKFYCENVKKLFEVIKLSRRGYKFKKGEIKILKDDLIIPDTIITDFKTLLMFHKEKKWIACKKLIVMDSIELTYHLKDMKHARFYYDLNITKVLKHFYTDNVLFLMPPNNAEIFRKKYPKIKYQVYFKGINSDMLGTIKHKNEDGYFFRWDTINEDNEQIIKKFGDKAISFTPEWTLKNNRRVPLKYNESGFIFDYNKLIYRRRKYLEYQEQFGRLIFEYILLGKSVYFLNEPYTDDGLTDYLRYYDIQFDSNNKIITTKEELKNKMKNIDKPWEG